MRNFKNRVVMYGAMVKAWNSHARDAGISCLKFTYHDTDESEDTKPKDQRKGSTEAKERMPEII